MGLSVTISSPSRSQKRRPTSVRSTTKNKLSTSPPNLSKLRLALNSPRGQYRNCKRRLTDWKMSSYMRRRNSRPSLMSLTKPLLKCPAINFSFFVSKIVKWPLDYFNILQSRTDQLSILCHSFYNSFLQDCSLISLISTTALHKLLVTLPAPTHQTNHLISRAGRLSFSRQLKTKKALPSFSYFGHCEISKNLFSHSIYRGSCNDIFLS